MTYALVFAWTLVLGVLVTTALYFVLFAICHRQITQPDRQSAWGWLGLTGLLVAAVAYASHISYAWTVGVAVFKVAA